MAITNFMNLADIYREADRGRAAQRQEDAYQRSLQQEKTLADIFSQQRGMDPSSLDKGSEYVAGSPEINSGTGGDGSYSAPPTGEYSPAVAEQAARPPNQALNALKKLEHAALTKRETSRKLGERGFGSLAAKVAAEADAIDEKIINSKLLISNKSGMDLKHPGLIEDEKGNLYNQYISSDGSTVIKNAVGEVVDPRTIKNPRITKGNSYITVAGPDNTTVVKGVPRAGGGNPSYRAPVQGDIEQVGKEYKESLEPIVPVMDRLDKLIAPIQKSGGKIPGVGFANNTKLGQLANDQGVGGSIYRDATALANAILKIRSGLAVTAQEESRTLIEMGRNPLASAAAFMDQFRKLQDAVDKIHSRIGAQYGEGAKIFDERQLKSGGYQSSKSPWAIRREQEQSNKLPPKDQLKADGKTRYPVNGKMMLWNGRGFVE